MTSEIPKRIKLVVNKGEDLKLTHPTKVIKYQPKKWRVLFLGVMEKMATAKVESDTGNPEWLCEITVTCKNSEDPISMLVTDSKGHHVGQVVIPLKNVPPKDMSGNHPSGRPPLLLTNIYKSELEATKKNSYPIGYLYYWMWAEEYWQLDEISKLKIKKSLSRSMIDLSNSTMNIFRRKKSNTSYNESQKEINNGNPFENSPENPFDSGAKSSPVKINQLKNLNYKSSSDTSTSAYSPQLASSSGFTHNSPSFNGYYSKNPFEVSDNSSENHMFQQERYDQNNHTSLSHQTSVCSKESPASNKKRHGLFTKFRAKKSQSSIDLNKMASESENKAKNKVPQSLGKQQGMRLFEKKNEMSKSSADITNWFCGDTPLQNNIIKSNVDTKINRPHSFLYQPSHDYFANNSHNPLPNQSELNGECRNCHTPVNLNRHCSFNLSPITTFNAANNNYEEMSKRELIDIISKFENDLKVSVEKIRSTESEVLKLQKEKKTLQDDLTAVRDELSKLKFKLLEAGDTQYLEKSRVNEMLERASRRIKPRI